MNEHYFHFVLHWTMNILVLDMRKYTVIFQMKHFQSYDWIIEMLVDGASKNDSFEPDWPTLFFRFHNRNLNERKLKKSWNNMENILNRYYECQCWYRWLDSFLSRQKPNVSDGFNLFIKKIFISIPIELRSNDLNLMKHALKWSVHMCRHNQKDPNQKD